ncbi:fasciclin domain-containing protein [Polaribacter tangerinus]|uniref:fasciclin domain-containing protein n=1 Tax=Polaribacter tangerinus TaxID=1920034 RepID=UPI000B4ADB03|nr:fasciclin domain-containing protein [Polaribacter tangerinus]
MKLVTKFFIGLLLIGGFYSCNNDNDDVIEPNTIVNVAVNNNLSSLVAAVTRADLVNTLNSPGPFTVLAPTNRAFTEFLSDNNFASVDDVPKELLTQILLNHVIDGSLLASGLSTGYATTKATSAASNTPLSLHVNTDNGVVFNGISKVITENIIADNGIVHVIDKVIGLPTVVTFATADSNFSSLVAALTRETNYTYVNTLSTANGTSPAPFTVFAPTNSAFASLLEELSLNNLSDVPTATLTSTLNTHVVAGKNVLENELTNNLQINTLGGNLTVNIASSGATLTDSKSRVSKIEVTNIQANNGVIHQIDTVVLE